ncbi:MAG: PepSY domain-containing protein [Bacteroidetes bacterium]|nr:PepSY domain-containing protein [Bacteroidota bacterium]
MKIPLLFYYRKFHRYFGVIIGVQFLFWTLGGMFFTFSDMDQIHGDTNRQEEKLISDLGNWQNPSNVFSEISKGNPVDSLVSFRTINFLNEPFYQVRYYSEGKQKLSLVNAKTGMVRLPISKEEAIAISSNVFTPNSEIASAELLTEKMINKHHEYRGSPLPAYAVTFAHNSGTTVYVSTEYGQVMTFRNSNWRIFDFLWMMHTMDYQSRDNIGNTLLRIFSALGLITILTGFVLYFKTSKWFIRKRIRNFNR